MKPIPDARPLSRAEASKQSRVNRAEGSRQNAAWVRQGFMNITGASHGVLIGSVAIIGHEDHEGTTYFRVRCCSVDTSSLQWDVIRRYNEFSDLRESLGVLDKRVGSIFPGKTGWFAAKEGELGQRAQLLQAWLNGLLKEFAGGGDGRNSLIPIGRSEKLKRLHRFFGVDIEGNLFPDSAPVAPTEAPPVAVATAVAAPVASAGYPVAVAVPADLLTQQALASAIPSAPPTATLENEQVAEEEQLRNDMEAIRLMEEKEAEEKERVIQEEERRRADEESDRLIREAEEAGRAAEEAARIQADEDERVRAAKEEEDGRIKAEEQEVARLAAEEAKAREAEEVRIQTEEAETTRLQAEEEARVVALEQARVKAEAEKSWLQRAVDMEKNAREIEAAGRTAEALQAFRNTIAVFKFVIKKEKSAKIQQMVTTRCDELSRHADKLWETMATAQLGSVYESSRPSATVAADPSAAPPAPVPATAAPVAPPAAALASVVPE